MPITYMKTQARFDGVVGIDDAEGLLAWLSAQPQARLQLAGCHHLHAAVLQLLLTMPCAVKAWPRDAGLRAWLEPLLDSAGTPIPTP